MSDAKRKNAAAVTTYTVVLSRALPTPDSRVPRLGVTVRQILTVVSCVASLCACFDITAADLFTCEPQEPVAQGRIEIFSYGGAVAVGDTLKLTAEVRPLVGGMVDLYGTDECHPTYGDPVPTPIEWSSSDKRIAGVSATGVVRGRAVGEVIITAEAPSRRISAARKIRVRVPG